ncbi:MAG: PEP-CTERM sorting domain-containing protein [Chthoniobacterales bacterium]
MKNSSKLPTLMTALALMLGVIATDNLHAQIYVTNAPGGAGAGSITKYDINGGGSSSFGTALTLPYDLALDASGNLYVAANGDNKVFKYNSSGASLGPSSGAWINSPGAAPFGIATSGSNLYIGVSNINEVDQYSAVTANTFNSVWLNNNHGGGTSGTVGYPDGLAIDTAGNVYVANYTLGTIGKWTPGSSTYNGSFITGIGTSNVGGITLDATGNIYVSFLNGSIHKYDSSGLNGSVFATGMNHPYQLATDGTYLYSANSGSNSVGRYLLSNGSIGTNTFITGLSNPIGIAVVMPVPEPSSVALVCIGGVAFASWRARKGMRKAA